MGCAKDFLITARNAPVNIGYRFILRPVLFQIDPEWVHDRFLTFGKIIDSNIVTKKMTSACFSYSNKMLKQEILGITFENPLGLAAGFDKNACMINTTKCVGFGFTEIGSITGEKCDGNPKPRLWRLKKSKALVVYYGLKNDGSSVMSKRLSKKKFDLPVGVSIAKTNSMKTTTLKPAIADYVKAYKKFANIGSYSTINLSCPNTFDSTYLFINPKNLDLLLKNITKIKTKKPIFVKISPDMNKQEIDGILSVIKKYPIKGIICTNLTKNRNNKNIKEKSEDLSKMKGGISGKVLGKLSDDMVSYIYKKTNGKLIIIGCGGVFTAKDAYKKIKSGASLIQLITGMIYNGPQSISDINLGLVKLLKRDGYTNISQAVGADVKLTKSKKLKN